MGKLLPGDIVLIHRGTGWQIFAPLVWLWQWAVGPYHVELGWDQSRALDQEYRAFSLQPPVAAIVDRKFTDVRITVYRLKDRPEFIDDMLYKWANDKIGQQLYILGWETCGMLPRDFYRDIVHEPCTNNGPNGPYPARIEKFCRKSDKFVEVV